MSLDVYLEQENAEPDTDSEHIFIRRDGATTEVSREEWEALFPGREPVVVTLPEIGQVYWRNITHNLNKMAGAAGIYNALWRPDEIGITKASQLIQPLTEGLTRLEAEPEEFKKYNPSNGWGDYQGLVEFVQGYLEACRKYPEATVRVSR